MSDNYHDILARHIQKQLPKDTVIYWDNIAGQQLGYNTSFVTVTIAEDAFDSPISNWLKGRIELMLSTPIGTGQAFHKSILSSIRQNLCFTRSKQLLCLDRQIGKSHKSAGYLHQPVTVDFICFRIATSGGA